MLSGSTNVGMAFDLPATRPAAESTYAGIVRMVEAAEHAKAPMVRLADRFAIWFLLATLAISGAAWLATGDPCAGSRSWWWRHPARSSSRFRSRSSPACRAPPSAASSSRAAACSRCSRPCAPSSSTRRAR